jgi:hypothetical protein
MKQKFKLTENHLKLLKEANVDYNDNCEFGAPEIDPKRPYGNSDVLEDIHMILTGKEVRYGDLSKKLQEKYHKLHKETTTALQIILYTQKFEVGTYENEEFYSNRWRKIS